MPQPLVDALAIQFRFRGGHEMDANLRASDGARHTFGSRSQFGTRTTPLARSNTGLSAGAARMEAGRPRVGFVRKHDDILEALIGRPRERRRIAREPFVL